MRKRRKPGKKQRRRKFKNMEKGSKIKYESKKEIKGGEIRYIERKNERNTKIKVILKKVNITGKYETNKRKQSNKWRGDKIKAIKRKK